MSELRISLKSLHFFEYIHFPYITNWRKVGVIRIKRVKKMRNLGKGMITINLSGKQTKLDKILEEKFYL